MTGFFLMIKKAHNYGIKLYANYCGKFCLNDVHLTLLN